MLSEIRRKKLTHLFHLRDTNNDGFLEKGDYERISKRLAEMFDWRDDSDMYQLMHRAQLFEWDELQKFADANQDDKVTLDEFLNAYDSMPSDEPIQVLIDDMVHFTFGWFDKDRDGHVQVDEYVTLLSVFNVSEEDATRAFSLLDSNKKGKLSENDLRTRMQEFYLSDDAVLGNHFWGKIE
jgi:Ca2+-binding EF-hand superfamily protein